MNNDILNQLLPVLGTVLVAVLVASLRYLGVNIPLPTSKAASAEAAPVDPIKTLIDRITNLEKDLEDVKVELDKERNQNRKLEAGQQEMQKTIDELRTQNQSERNHTEQVDSERIALIRKNTEMDTELQTAKKKIETQTGEIAELKKQVAELQRKLEIRDGTRELADRITTTVITELKTVFDALRLPLPPTLPTEP